MGLLRTILALVILVILSHVTLTYLGYTGTTNSIVSAIYSLGVLLESPAHLFLTGAEFYTTALAAAAGYLILYILLGATSR